MPSPVNWRAAPRPEELQRAVAGDGAFAGAADVVDDAPVLHGRGLDQRGEAVPLCRASGRRSAGAEA